MAYRSKKAPTKLSDARVARKTIAEATLAAMERGTFSLDEIRYDLKPYLQHSSKNIQYYAPDSILSTWAPHARSRPKSDVHTRTTEISILEISTLSGARLLSTTATGRLGVLNFASAKKPGGGFLSGAQAQEESIARSSTLYPSLMTDTGQQFYQIHKRDSKGGYYTHAMLYTPGVLSFRDDSGAWVEPIEMDVLTSAAVNAGVARKTLFGIVGGQAEEGRIEKAMRERMARILYLFERQGARNLVLGSFGTGVFQNNILVVARIWADLLAIDDAPFKDVFERVVFAILGRATFQEFKDAFEERSKNGPGSGT